jgi:multiple sugar transport system ATP-binding protein
MSFLEVKNLVKTFGNTEVLKGINLELVKGKFLVLVGPSGCGKSTLLNLIAGLNNITSGEISINDRVVNNIHPGKRNIAMVFQSYALYPNMTVGKNISFGLEIRKISKAQVQTKTLEVAKLLQIEHLMDRKPAQLSGGQRQRVAMGRALVRDPDLFLFDEPLSNLDAKLRVDMRTEIKKLHQTLKATIVYVTHDQIEALTLADYVAVMYGGEIQQFGSPHDIYNQPDNLFVANFMGSPSMNFIKGTIQKDANDFIIVIKENGRTIQLPISQSATEIGNYVDKKVILGLRPEAINLFRVGQDDEKMGVDCKIEIIEPTGADTYAVLSFNKEEILSRMRPERAVDLKEIEKFNFNMNKAVFFDPDTEKRIG